MSSAGAAIEAVNITKAYGATLALHNVNFSAEVGRVNVLMGENGAGKSTLMKILAGEEAPDEGDIFCDGHRVVFDSPGVARDHGVVLIHQELSLFPALTVAENIFVGRERHRLGVIDERTEIAASAAALEKLDLRIDPRVLVSALAVGQQQLVEIARALCEDARVLIMDEPTSALSNAEVDSLFHVISELTSRKVTIIYISHRMDEIFRIADTLVVLRDGHLVASTNAHDADMEWVLDNMLGTEQRAKLSAVQSGRGHDAVESGTEDSQAAPILAVKGLVLADSRSERLLLSNVSLSLWAGEVLGVYGLLGSGKTELAETIAGHRRDVVGEVRIEGVIIKNSISARMRAGVALVPEDRKRDGLVRTASIADNILLSSFSRVGRYGVFSTSHAERVVGDAVNTLAIRVGNTALPVVSLSGGNQQKTVIARALLTQPKILILDEPTRGIDVGAKAEVYDIVRVLAKKGLAVLFCSSELAEVMAVTDRIMVLCRGHVQRVFDSRTTSEAEVALASNATV